jgi:hypothetical protein
MPILPPDLQALLDEIDRLDRAADTLSSPLSDTQFYWQPDGGRAWSIALCLEHLATANRVYSTVIRGAVDVARARGLRRTGPIASTYFGRRFIASLEPAAGLRTRAPAKIRPGPVGAREIVLKHYHDAHDAVRRLLVDAADIDVNRATFRNPFLPLVRVRVGTGFRVIAAHDRRHLWQADQVRHKPGFPPK